MGLGLTRYTIVGILEYNQQIKALFETGLQGTKCNCQEFLDPNFIGECLETVKSLDDQSIRCPKCPTLRWCCKTNLNIHPEYGWDYPNHQPAMTLRSGTRVAKRPTPSEYNYTF